MENHKAKRAVNRASEIEKDLVRVDIDNINAIPNTEKELNKKK
jgi:hypothetical protein